MREWLSPSTLGGSACRLHSPIGVGRRGAVVQGAGAGAELPELGHQRDAGPDLVRAPSGDVEEQAVQRAADRFGAQAGGLDRESAQPGRDADAGADGEAVRHRDAVVVMDVVVTAAAALAASYLLGRLRPWQQLSDWTADQARFTGT